MNAELPDFIALRVRYEDTAFPSGAKAELRRVAEPEDLSLTTALYRLFPGVRPDGRHLRVAYLLPWCKHTPKATSLGVQLADANVAETRVLQTARARTPEDIVHLRRLAMHIEPSVDWSSFGRTLWFWNERAKREIVEDFYITRFKPAQGRKQ